MEVRGGKLCVAFAFGGRMGGWGRWEGGGDGGMNREMGDRLLAPEAIAGGDVSACFQTRGATNAPWDAVGDRVDALALC